MNTIEIEYEGLELQVDFEYQPEEKMVMYYPDGSGYPGCPAEITLGAVIVPGLEIDIFPLLKDRQRIAIEDLVWDRYGSEKI